MAFCARPYSTLRGPIAARTAPEWNGGNLAPRPCTSDFPRVAEATPRAGRMPRSSTGPADGSRQRKSLPVGPGRHSANRWETAWMKCWVGVGGAVRDAVRRRAPSPTARGHLRRPPKTFTAAPARPSQEYRIPWPHPGSSSPGALDRIDRGIWRPLGPSSDPRSRIVDATKEGPTAPAVRQARRRSHEYPI